MRRAILLLIASAGCDWSLHRMQQQPRCEAYEPTTLFANGACNQAPPAGVVPFGDAFDDEAPPPEGGGGPTGSAGGAGVRPRGIDAALIARGRDRFERFCAPCHGALGDGDSAVARDMQLRKPPSLVDARAAGLPDARILVTITRGYGLMPAYGDALVPRDRAAVLQFVRVLQRREIAVDELPPDLHQEATSWLR